MLRLTKKVAARYIEARKTQNLLLLEGLFDAFMKPLVRLDRTFGRQNEDLDAIARQLSEASKDLLKELVITSDHPGLAAGLKKHHATIRNFRKMLESYVKADTWAELGPVLKAQRTKSKGAYEKAAEYRDHILGLVRSYDTEVETTLKIGDYTVILMTVPRQDWNQDLIDRLKEILNEVDRALARGGLGSVAGGTIYAYPTGRLPPSAFTSSNAFASYLPSRDILSLAVDAPFSKLLFYTLHELGHRVYFKLVEGRGRTAWSDFFEGGKGTPDIDSILSNWERYIANPPNYEAEKYGRYLGYYVTHLTKKGDDNAMWLNLLADQLDIKEKFDYMTGSPKKGTVPGLDQLLAKRGEAKVFLYPVTAYSGTSAEELFAETFAALTTGTKREKIHPLVEHAFRETLPRFRMATESVQYR